jgi:nucleoside-diphosphate-sugar epimerase
MASIAVTGAAGFLGSHVGDALLAARGGMVSYPAQAEVRRR